jgi:hypothetical protein
LWFSRNTVSDGSCHAMPALSRAQRWRTPTHGSDRIGRTARAATIMPSGATESSERRTTMPSTVTILYGGPIRHPVVSRVCCAITVRSVRYSATDRRQRRYVGDQVVVEIENCTTLLHGAAKKSESRTSCGAGSTGGCCVRTEYNKHKHQTRTAQHSCRSEGQTSQVAEVRLVQAARHVADTAVTRTRSFNAPQIRHSIGRTYAVDS